MTDTALECPSCHAPVADDDLRCRACAAPLPARGQGAVQVGEKLQDGAWSKLKRVCGWCGSSTKDPRDPDCDACGGPLPPVPPRILAELDLPIPVQAHPPDGPRQLPAGYARRVKYTGNTYVMIGIIFVIPLFWSVAFPIIGAFIWWYGARKAARWLKALEAGQAVEGTITKVFHDTQQKINNESPWQIDYRFETPSGTREGFVTSWDPLTPRRQAGERVWVVYDPVEVESSALWPPVW